MRRLLPICFLASACSLSVHATGGSTSAGGSTGNGGASAGGATTGSSTASSSGGSGGSASSCVAPIGLADISAPATTITDCSFASLETAIAAGGVIAFNCTGTVTFTQTLALRGDVSTVIDGNNTVTLDGGGVQMFTGQSTAPDPTGQYFRDSDITITFQRITIQNAAHHGTTAVMETSTPDPNAVADNCSTGFTDGEGGVLSINNMTVHVIDSTFLNNSAEALGPDVGGGALYVLGSKDTTIVNSTFSGNSGANGGAIGSLLSNLTLVNDTFTNNQALGFGENGDDGPGGPCPEVVNGQHQTGSGGNGGAISIDGSEFNADKSPTVKICGTTFSNNRAGALGGALFRTPDDDNNEQETDIDQSTFVGNTSLSGGGALYFHNSFLDIDATLFSANTTQGNGGAIFTDNSNPSISNTTFAGNQCAVFGGAMVLFTCKGTAPCALQNCTFSDNQATVFSGALGGDPFAITNTLFDANTAPNPVTCASGDTGANDLQWPTSSDPACVAGILSADPTLGTLADNGGPSQTLLPAAASPAIGAGASCSDHDQRLLPRATKCTIGAVEVQP